MPESIDVAAFQAADRTIYISSIINISLNYTAEFFKNKPTNEILLQYEDQEKNQECWRKYILNIVKYQDTTDIKAI